MDLELIIFDCNEIDRSNGIESRWLKLDSCSVFIWIEIEIVRRRTILAESVGWKDATSTPFVWFMVRVWRNCAGGMWVCESCGGERFIPGAIPVVQLP